MPKRPKKVRITKAERARMLADRIAAVAEKNKSTLMGSQASALFAGTIVSLVCPDEGADVTMEDGTEVRFTKKEITEAAGKLADRWLFGAATDAIAALAEKIGKKSK